MQGCLQLGKALDMPPTATLSGLLLLISYCSSDCVVEIPDIQWIEPVLVWITISMASGSGKTPLFTFLVNLLEKVKYKFDRSQQCESPDWVLDDGKWGQRWRQTITSCWEYMMNLEHSSHRQMLAVGKHYWNHMNLLHFCHFTMLKILEVFNRYILSVCM